MSQRPGAYRCVGLRVAVALTFRPFKAVPYPKGTTKGNFAVVRGSLALSGSWSRCGWFAGPGRTVWHAQSHIAFLAPPARSLPDQRT